MSLVVLSGYLSVLSSDADSTPPSTPLSCFSPGGSSVRFITEDELKQLEQGNLSLPEDAVLLVNYRRKSAPLPVSRDSSASSSSRRFPRRRVALLVVASPSSWLRLVKQMRLSRLTSLVFMLYRPKAQTRRSSAWSTETSSSSLSLKTWISSRSTSETGSSSSYPSF